MDWVVPFVDLEAQAVDLGPQLEASIARVVRSGVYVLGEEVARFEARAAAYLGTKHAIGVSSGSDALVVALLASNVGPGDEVITSPFTFFATVESILRVGAVPRFVDVERDSLNLDTQLVESAINDRTRAILPVHLFGSVVDLRPLEEIARRCGIAIIEDAAQAFASRWRARFAGTWGRFGVFSFFPTKVLGALGDAGMVVTDRDELAARCRQLRQHGAVASGEYVEMGGNFRMDALHAAVLSSKLTRLDRWLQVRREHAMAYDQSFSETGGLTTIRHSAIEEWNAAIYTVRVLQGRRDDLERFLTSRGIEPAVYYRAPAHLQPALRFHAHRPGSFPEAEEAARSVLSLPVHAQMTVAQRRLVIDAVREFFD